MSYFLEMLDDVGARETEVEWNAKNHQVPCGVEINELEVGQSWANQQR